MNNMGSWIIVREARLFDGREKVIENAVIVIDPSGYIRDVGSEGSVEYPRVENIIEINARGLTALPGLIDAHMHLTGFRTGDVIKEPLLTPYETLVARCVVDLESLINAGFTTVVDAGSVIALGLKQAVEEGSIKGPRIIAAGLPISQTFGHGDTHYLPIEYVDYRTTKLNDPIKSLICDGVDECRKATRYALRMGSDFIKIFTTGGVLSQRDRPEYTQFTLDEIKAIVYEAEAAGRFVHAHAEGSKGIINALEGGVKVIAHADMIDEDGITLALEKNAVIVPTLAVSEHIINYGAELGLPSWAIEKENELYKHHVDNVRRAYREGVKIATGTDFWGGVKAFRHGDNALEIVLFVEKLGMTPKEAIKSATAIASEVAGLKDIGAIEKGRKADLILIEGNPLDNIKLILSKEKVKLVMKNGKILKNGIEQ
ncbi:MAG: amidohydrolase family protein [Desulfurococcaceae archaeon]